MLHINSDSADDTRRTQQLPRGTEVMDDYDTQPCQDINDERGVPQPPAYIENPVSGDDGDYEKKIECYVHVHGSPRIPKFECLQSPDPSTLPTYEYAPLNDERDEIRLLVLDPHRGDPIAPVQCHLLAASLTHDKYCYLHVRNTRGHKDSVSSIVVDGRAMVVTKNVELFLRHFRQERRPLLLWIRELCFNQEDLDEKRRHYNNPRFEWVFDHSCRYLNLNDYLDELLDKAIISNPDQSRAKSWDSPTTQRRQGANYFPNHVGELTFGDLSDPRVLPYRYLPLDVIAGEIRLIVLLPAEDPSSPLIAHFAYERLGGEVAYTCLSYAWGNPTRTSRILINGRSMMITENLELALRDIRQKSHPLTIWADAISIDQENVHERSREVRRMHKIYENADSVIAWLGPGNEASDRAMDFIINFNPKAEAPSYEENISVYVDILVHLLARPYFRRLWPVQEIANSSLLCVFCGRKFCRWERFHILTRMMIVHLDQFVAPIKEDPELRPGEYFSARMGVVSQTHRLAYHRQLRKLSKPTSFLHVALTIGFPGCTDPRDKIYALMNLASDTCDLDIKSDYTKSVRQVYIDFAKAYISTYKKLDIICAAHPSGLEDYEDMPSWCPDWRLFPSHSSLIQEDRVSFVYFEDIPNFDKPLYEASRGNVPAACYFLDDAALVCTGTVVDIIEILCPIPDGPLNIEGWLLVAERHAHRNGVSLTPDEARDQLLSLLRGDPLGGSRCESIDSRARMTRRPAHVDPSPHDEFEQILKMTRGRTLTITKKGYMGLAPRHVKVGWKLCILLGCSVPVILEPRQERFRFQGSIYVQGWMNGEMLDEYGSTDEEITERITKEPPLVII